MAADLTIRRLSSGWWHVRGRGLCNWAQVPSWPCTDDDLTAGTFEEAGDSFRRTLRRARDRAMNEVLRAG